MMSLVALLSLFLLFKGLIPFSVLNGANLRLAMVQRMLPMRPVKVPQWVSRFPCRISRCIRIPRELYRRGNAQLAMDAWNPLPSGLLTDAAVIVFVSLVGSRAFPVQAIGRKSSNSSEFLFEITKTTIRKLPLDPRLPSMSERNASCRRHFNQETRSVEGVDIAIPFDVELKLNFARVLK